MTLHQEGEQTKIQEVQPGVEREASSEQGRKDAIYTHNESSHPTLESLK
jgi:hypothetical protein